MNTIDAIKNRYSCRNFDGRQISEEDLNLIIDSGCSAPVARGLYDLLHITVVQNELLLNEIFDKAEAELYKSMNVRKNMNFGAKTLIIVSSKPLEYAVGMDYVNAGCIVENMILAATSLGIDNVMMAAPTRAIANEKELLAKLGIPNGYIPLLCASFGYRKEEELPKKHTISINRI